MRIVCLPASILVAALLVSLPLAGFLAGCESHRLETGYEYQPLNSSSVERRAFYADPYSLEARRAEAERQQAADSPLPRQQP